jgi:hypothetical protein
VRETDGKEGVEYKLRKIKLPDGTELSGETIRELSRTQKGCAKLRQLIEMVVPTNYILERRKV